MSELTNYITKTKKRMKGYSLKQIHEMGGYNLYYRPAHSSKVSVKTLERINKYMDENKPEQAKRGRPRKGE